ncbi:multiheme c-type cytochrome [Helicobacter cetorum]|uniref:multiheme c-type cytochrome n=1 Tax=Helicobacter cetorum TaxID=138563 RepID=UPI000CF01CE5|nr:multiheme c-type cytochrome [Helicobacter cetorum]
MFKRLSLVFLTLVSLHADTNNKGGSNVNSPGLQTNVQLKVFRELKPEAKGCIECHAKENPGVVNDWRKSRHAHAGVSCIDCHGTTKDSPMLTMDGHKGSKTPISVLVSPNVCGKCHEKEVKEFHQSGHSRGALQPLAKGNMRELMRMIEGRNHPDLKQAPEATGCFQCHGTVIKLDKNHRPTPETWPTYGIGTAFPDGSVGNCASCHSAHKFSLAESRKPAACASCHMGPDHPDIEIYNNSMHGHIFNSENAKWNFDAAPGTWGVADFRAPTCATCHMSGNSKSDVTHNVSRRLKWNMFAPRSELRTGGYETAANDWANGFKITKGNILAGNPKGPDAAREEMKAVCKDCHTVKHVENVFTMGDKNVMLFNTYYDDAVKMRDELKKKGLLEKDPWSDEFQKTFYHLWHHEGRRMRHGGLMGAPDYSHWHGVFEVQQDIRKLKKIYDKRMKSGKIED